jgi:hypothetical protein
MTQKYPHCTTAVRLRHFAISYLSYYATARQGTAALAVLAPAAASSEQSAAVIVLT